MVGKSVTKERKQKKKKKSDRKEKYNMGVEIEQRNQKIGKLKLHHILVFVIQFHDLKSFEKNKF